MFTGIVATTGRIESVEHYVADRRLGLNTGRLDLSDVSLGDSICVSGACLTVVELGQQGFVTDVSTETLACTTLGALQTGDRVNLEKAMRPTDRFSGHIVSGHVDGIGKVLAMHENARSVRCQVAVPALLLRYICRKGSVCIDGVSLTINAVHANRFDVNIIPHTLEETIFSEYEVGTSVNLEVDLIARYLERLSSKA